MGQNQSQIDHIVSIDDFKILAASDSNFHVKIKESILISSDEPILNKNLTSLPLYLFAWSLYISMIFIIVTVIVLV